MTGREDGENRRNSKAGGRSAGSTRPDSLRRSNGGSGRKRGSRPSAPKLQKDTLLDRIGEGAFESSDSSNRPEWVLIFFLIMVALIVIRLFTLQIIDVYGYGDTGSKLRTAEETVYAKRGTIYDRNGNILAMSVEASTVCCDPRQVADPNATAQELANFLGGQKEDYIESLTRDSGFSYIKRQVDASVGDAISSRKSTLRSEAKAAREAEVEAAKNAGTYDEESDNASDAIVTVLDGVYCVDDMKRVYPYGSAAGQVLGSVNVDGEGISGIELQYDDILKGANGKQKSERGRFGMEIPGGTVVEEEAQDGQDIMISIDVELQAAAEESLSQQVTDSNANSGNLVVIDGSTGEIYASCSTPLFDPGNRVDAEEGAQSLKSVTTTYEPGSIFKPVTAAMLLDQGLATSDETITVPGYLDYGQWTITDAHDHGTQDMTFKEIIEQSSNIGITLLEERLGSENFYNHIVEYGFGTATGVDYPGELDGKVPDYSEWSEVQEANISFGQGLTVTTTQMASFYGVLASGGTYVKPHYLIGYPDTGETVSYESKQLVTSATCDVLDDMLSGVVEDGTGTLAAIEGYTVAGKTGTSQKIEEDGTYSQGAYVISFDGYLPYTNSSLACAVSMDNPDTSAAMPVFSQVMQTAAEMYRITSNPQ